MIWRLLIIILCFLTHLTGVLIGQNNRDFSGGLKFIMHLQSRGNNNEALYLLENLNPDNQARKDSVNYLKGWLLYGQKDLETSAFYLTKVSEQSAYFEKSIFFAAYNHAYLFNTDVSLQLLDNFSTDASPAVLAMTGFQKAGVALLDRRLKDFNLYAEDFRGTFAFMATEEEKLREYYTQISNKKNRSPLLAGMLSAAVPGLGKMYAGKTSEGISNLLYVGAMFLASWDFYNRLGPRNPFFIISAGVTGVFYVGNIWGSATAVNRVNKEFNHEINQRILLDMHIPLRRLYP